MHLKGTHRHTYTHVCANSLMHSLIHSSIPSHAHSPTYQKTPPHIRTHFLMRRTDMNSPTLVRTITHTCANAPWNVHTHTQDSFLGAGCEEDGIFQQKMVEPACCLAPGCRRPNNWLCRNSLAPADLNQHCIYGRKIWRPESSLPSWVSFESGV